MKKQNILSTSLVCLLTLLTGIALRAEQVFEEIIVRVNNDIITKSDYEKTKDLIRKELQKNLKGPDLDKAVAQQEKDLLKTMIEDQLMVQKAADLSLSADTEVIKYLDRIRRDQNIADMETLEKMMVQQGSIPSSSNRTLRIKA
jgi:peptidyl-prolyl cis-trans isomerase SurA